MISSGLPPLTLASEAPSSWLRPPFTTASPRLALCPWSTRQDPPLHWLCPPLQPPFCSCPYGASPARRRKLPALALPCLGWSCASIVSPVVQMVNFRKVPVPRPGFPVLWQPESWPGLAAGRKGRMCSAHMVGMSQRDARHLREVGMPRSRGRAGGGAVGRQVHTAPPTTGQPDRG